MPHGFESLSTHSRGESCWAFALTGVTMGDTDPQQYGQRMTSVTVESPTPVAPGAMPSQSTAMDGGGSCALVYGTGAGSLGSRPHGPTGVCSSCKHTGGRRAAASAVLMLP